MAFEYLGCYSLFQKLTALANCCHHEGHVPYFHGHSQPVALVMFFPAKHTRPCLCFYPKQFHNIASQALYLFHLLYFHAQQ